VIHSLNANIWQFKHCKSLINLFLWGANVFTLNSNEHYFRSRNLALLQDSHSLRGSTRDLWTVVYFYWLLLRGGIAIASHATATIFWSSMFPNLVLIFPDSSTSVLCFGCSRHLLAKRGETGRDMAGSWKGPPPPSIHFVGGWVFYAGDRTPVVQSVVRHYTDRASPSSGIVGWTCHSELNLVVTARPPWKPYNFLKLTRNDR
jgi:hypothetical protein